ncbi:alkaline phosphatase family protein [Streptomyces albidoflavus]
MSRGPSRRTLLLTAALATAAAPLAAFPAHAAARTPKVLVIGLDGALLDRIEDAGAPHLGALMAAGLTAPSTLYAEPLAPTVSGPGWSTVLTGVWPDKHRVTDNTFAGHALDRYPDFLTRVETARPGASTYAVASWAPVTTTILSPAVDTRVSTPADEYDTGTTRRAVAELRDGDRDAVVVHLDNIDHAGHSDGAASEAYLAAVRTADAQIGEMVAAVAARPSYAAEDWLIMVTSDHGHTPAGGHGGNTLAERQTFLIARGGGVPAGTTRHDVRMPDVAASALHHLGIAIPDAWELDGRPLQTPVSDAFDTLRPELRTRADETGIDPALLGFTLTPPAGWAVENGAMGDGGVGEWRGWTFTTDAFWTSAERGQQRESNLRARDVFAVADGDEWADKPFTGTFDSTLVTPPWPVTGGSPAVLRYTTYYRHEAPQRAEVLVSYDGAPPALVKTYTADTPSRTEKLTLQVPPGARNAQIRFRYTAGNNWFWTVDAVSLTAS